ncbi:MAG: hypothetical protein RLZZ136_1531 [Pseudomonadota bacterium]
MSNINLQIGGRSFKVACAPGEEDHITGLGQMIDSKIASMNMAGQTESRMLLFAALLLADEVHEVKHRRADGSAPPPPQPDPAIAAALAEKLETIASALEKCALSLEG